MFCLTKLVNKTLNNNILVVLNTMYFFNSYNIIGVCYSIDNFTKAHFLLRITAFDDS